MDQPDKANGIEVSVDDLPPHLIKLHSDRSLGYDQLQVARLAVAHELVDDGAQPSMVCRPDCRGCNDPVGQLIERLTKAEKFRYDIWLLVDEARVGK